jgi:hypothetical protein
MKSKSLLVFLLLAFTNHKDPIDAYFEKYHVFLSINKMDTTFKHYGLLYEMMMNEEISDTHVLNISNLAVQDSLHFNFKNQTYTIHITTSRFDSTKHTIERYKGKVLCIDNKVKLGSKYLMPETEIRQFKIHYKGKPVAIPLEKYKNMYDLHLGYDSLFSSETNQYHTTSLARVYESKKDGYFFLVLVGGDGGYYYTSTFVFRNGKFVGRDLGFI